MKRQRIFWLILAVICLGSGRVVLADDDALPVDQVAALGRQLETTFNAGDGATATGLLDVDALLDRTMQGITAPAQFQNAFRDGFERGATIMSSLVKATTNGGGYRFLRVRKVQGETRALCRLLSKEGGLNYHDWIVGKDAQGQMKFVDFYVATSGETMSQTLRRLYLSAAIRANLGMLNQLNERDKEYVASVTKIAQLFRDVQASRYNDAMSVYKTMTPAVQESKPVMVMRVTVTEKLRKQAPEDYAKAITDFERLFPGDPSLDLLCLNEFIDEKKFAEAHQSLDRLERFTGGDPYLQYMRGNLFMIEGGAENFAAAKKMFQDSIDAEPTLHRPYWGLVTLSLKTRDFDQTAAMLEEIHRKLHVRIANLTVIPLYAEFVKSDAYSKWKAAYDAEGAGATTQ
jgi:tetratricopeptide (TPR) repeat protein